MFVAGLTAELYYVRAGVVNDYAMNWRVPVAADVHRLYFTWQALVKKPVSTPAHLVLNLQKYTMLAVTIFFRMLPFLALR